MAIPRLIDNQRGVALITVVLVALAVSSVAVAASMMTMSGTLVRKYSERTSIADHAALSGVERGLSALLGDTTNAIYPTSGYTTLEDSVPVVDAMGNPIPDVWRSVYIGPSSDPSRGSIISQVWARGGVKAVRRMEVEASSFASYGYFVDDDPYNIGFAREDDVFGPIHFDDNITVWSAGASDSATFWGEVTTTGSVISPGYGSFRKGYTEGASNVFLPSSGDLAGLESMATSAGLRFNSTSTGPNSAPMRLEFVAVDMDGDITTTNDVEGFVRIYDTGDINSTDRAYVLASAQPAALPSPITTPNCGVWNSGSGEFESVSNGRLPNGTTTAEAAVDSNRYRCYLGGDPILNDGVWQSNIGPGSWVTYTGPAISSPGFDATPGNQFLHPYGSALNSNSAGVIWVAGDVAVSGVVAGKVTVVAADDIIIADDLVQYTDPGQSSCPADMLGLIASDDMVIADNTINTPQRYIGGTSYHTMDDTKDEFVHAVMLALSEFRVHNALSGPDDTDNGGFGAEPCESIPTGNGCLYVVGGILQDDRGYIGDGSGHLLRHSYNQCVLQGGPPQFPSTGSFSKRRVVEMDGSSFDPVTWFAAYQS